MDLGALGINFPMICSGEEAKKAVRSVRYPPRGDRLWGRSTPRFAGASRCRTTWRPLTMT